eukprot:3613536-Rhodomonas_salina.3
MHLRGLTRIASVQKRFEAHRVEARGNKMWTSDGLKRVSSFVAFATFRFVMMTSTQATAARFRVL